MNLNETYLVPKGTKLYIAEPGHYGILYLSIDESWTSEKPLIFTHSDRKHKKEKDFLLMCDASTKRPVFIHREILNESNCITEKN